MIQRAQNVLKRELTQKLEEQFRELAPLEKVIRDILPGLGYEK